MALPLVLYHPGILFGVQVLVAAIVFCVLYFLSPTSIFRASGLSILALIATAVATTFLARVPLKKPGETKKAPTMPAYVLLSIPAGLVVFGAYSIATYLLLDGLPNGKNNARQLGDNMIAWAAGIAAALAVFFSFVWTSAFYEQRKGSTTSPAAAPEKGQQKPAAKR